MMARGKADKAFEVCTEEASVIVVARHAKGARTVAREFIAGVTPTTLVVELDVSMLKQARNLKDKS
jgi:hypothetical protein